MYLCADKNYDCEGSCINDTDGDGICDEYEIDGCTEVDACTSDSYSN